VSPSRSRPPGRQFGEADRAVRVDHARPPQPALRRCAQEVARAATESVAVALRRGDQVDLDVQALAGAPVSRDQCIAVALQRTCAAARRRLEVARGTFAGGESHRCVRMDAAGRQRERGVLGRQAHLEGPARRIVRARQRGQCADEQRERGPQSGPGHGR